VRVSDNDPLSGPAMFAPLGDAIAFRDVCTALRTLVLRSGEDPELVVAAADGDDDATRVRLSELLRFADAGAAWGLGPPTVDWRVQLDFAVAESPEEIAARLRDDAAGREAWERAATAYTRFVREIFDAGYVPPQSPW